ncbi:MAG TPA: HAD-IIIA family hydrolase, partial [Pirellulales bacterium]|nr:HAD-IIIA family hydrolase [Pirellulales bacterium]
IVVTNQAGVARGLFGESIIARVHERLDELLAAREARIDRYYHCPHHPEGSVAKYAIECQCRKPRPGMLHRASTEMHLDLAGSWLVGDKLSDLEAAAAAGCEPLLVTTGYGAETAARIERSSLAKTHIFASLVDAVDFCLRAQ